MNAFEAHRAALAILVLVAAALICAGVIKLVLPLLRLYGVARPNARSSHLEPTPQGGGIAVVVASLSIAGAAAMATGLAIPTALYSAALLIALVGLVDDIRPIPVLPRLPLHSPCVAAVSFRLPPVLPLA